MFQTDRPQAMTPDLSKAESDAEKLLSVSRIPLYRTVNGDMLVKLIHLPLIMLLFDGFEARCIFIVHSIISVLTRIPRTLNLLINNCKFIFNF